MYNLANAEQTAEFVDIVFELAAPIQSNIGMDALRERAIRLVDNLISKHNGADNA